MFSDSSKELIVITTQTRWDEPPRMRHHVAYQLSRRFNVLFIELYSKGLAKKRKISDTLYVLKLGGYIRGLQRLYFLQSIYNTIQAFLITQHLKRSKSKTILMNFDFKFHQIFRNKKFVLKYFFLNDDFINMYMSDSETTKQKKKKLQDKVVALSDHVFASSEPLAEDVRKKAKGVSVIYSGHDFEVRFDENFPQESKKKLNTCIMGFISANLEVGWLGKLANCENIDLNFIGPIEKKDIQDRFSRFENVKFYGPRTRSSLQDFLLTQDVFLMPYTNELLNTKASVPAKLYQYLACGKPIVSSLMPNLINLPVGFVYQSSTADQFVKNVILSAENDSNYLRKKRVEFAAMNTWTKRGNDLIKIVESHLFTKNCRGGSMQL